MARSKRRNLPCGEATSLDLLDASCVGEDGLFLEVADEAVARAGRDHVAEDCGGARERGELWARGEGGLLTEGIVEDALRGEHHGAEEARRFLERHEGHEVHALVLRLLEQRVDPALVASLHRGTIAGGLRSGGSGLDWSGTRCEIAFRGRTMRRRLRR